VRSRLTVNICGDVDCKVCPLESISAVVEIDGRRSYKVPLPGNRGAFFYIAQTPLPLAVSRPAAKWIRDHDEKERRDEDIHRTFCPDVDARESLCQSKMETVY
jgi:hypothetical protein